MCLKVLFLKHWAVLVRSGAWHDVFPFREYCQRVIDAIRVCGVGHRYDILPLVCYIWVNCSGTCENLQQVAIDIDRLVCMVDLYIFEWTMVSGYWWYRPKWSWRELWFSVFQDYAVWSVVRHVAFHKHVMIQLAAYTLKICFDAKHIHLERTRRRRSHESLVWVSV